MDCATGNSAGAGDLADTLDLPADSSVTYTMRCEVDVDAQGTLTNTVTVAGSALDPDTGNNTATDSDTLLIEQADLSIRKSDDRIAAMPGESVTYQIVASNEGPADDPDVMVSDVLPSVLDCTRTSVATGGATGNSDGVGDLGDNLSMPAGSAVTYSMVCDLDHDASGFLSNTATIAGSVSDPNPDNNSATDEDTVLGIVAELSLAMVTWPELALNPGIGSSFDYVILVDNHGPGDATGVQVTDDLPSAVDFVASDCGAVEEPSGSGHLTWDIGDLAAGADVMCSITVEVTGFFEILNIATVTANEFDNEVEDNSDRSYLNVFVHVLDIPTLGDWARFLLALLIAFVGSKHLIERRRARSG